MISHKLKQLTRKGVFLVNELRNKEMQGEELFLIGTFILNLLFFALTNTTLLFAIGIPVNRLNLLSAVVCAGFACFFLSGRSLKRTAMIVLMGVLVLGISVLLSARVYDCSWDGNRYHKSITGLLNYGWNPLRVTFYDFAKQFPFLAEVEETWYDAYPKGTEIWAACLYVITNDIETGKSFNILAIAALFCICYALLTQTRRLTRVQMLLCTFFCVVNPVALAQVATYYVDGFVWQIFLACMASLLYLTFFEGGKYQNSCMYLIFISITLGLNVKFSALLYFGLLCLCFFGFWSVQKYQREGWQKSKEWIKKRFCFFAVSAVFGTAFAGATSYGINLVRYANPVYTMLGEGSTEMITSQLPVAYRNKSHLARFIASLLSRTSNNKALDHIEWKIPFTYSSSEFSAAQTHDARVAGWGLLFGGIFLLSIIVLWVAGIRLMGKAEERQRRAAILGELLLTVFALSIILVPGLCWARYNGVLFYIPVAALIYLFAFINQNRQTAALPAFTAGVLSMTLTLNIVPNLERIRSDYKEFPQIRNQLMELKEASDSRKEPIKIGYSSQYRFEGRFFTLYDMGITNFVYTEVDPQNCEGALFNRNGLCYGEQKVH